jgi:hypothetical protein
MQLAEGIVTKMRGKVPKIMNIGMFVEENQKLVGVFSLLVAEAIQTIGGDPATCSRNCLKVEAAPSLRCPRFLNSHTELCKLEVV